MGVMQAAAAVAAGPRCSNRRIHTPDKSLSERLRKEGERSPRRCRRSTGLRRKGEVATWEVKTVATLAVAATAAL